MLLLEEKNTKKKLVEKILELNVGNKNSKKYKVKVIRNSAIYIKESKSHLSKLYYLIK